MTSRRKGQQAASDGTSAFSLISEQKLLAIYQSILNCHLLRDELRRLKVGSGHAVCGPVAGHEAMLASLTADLKAEDALSLPAVDSAAGFLKGQPLRSILQMALPVSKSHGPHSPRLTGLSKENVAPAAKSTATQLHLACGLALGRANAAPGSVVAVFCSGSGATSACWGEVLTLASKCRLPMIFMNHEASPGLGQFAGMARSARVHGVPLILTDALDAVALYRVVYESLSRARQGRGPTLIVCRNEKTRPTAKGRDGLGRMEEYLRQRGMFDPDLCHRSAERFLRSFRAANPKSRASKALRNKGDGGEMKRPISLFATEQNDTV